MIEGVYIPNYFDIYHISSYYMSKLFNNKKMVIKLTDEKKQYFSLEILRDLYQENKEEFKKTTLELLLRGFIVKTNKSSNIFPESYIKGDCKVIEVNTHLNEISLEKIDFQILHLGSLLNVFKVESSDFFENIPLEGFLSINQYVNLSLLESEFLEAGYEIKKISLSPHDNIFENLSQNERRNFELFEPEILKIIRDKNYLHIIELKHIVMEDTEEFNYFEQREIHYVYELTEQEIKKYYLQMPEACENLLLKIQKKLSNKNITFYLIEAFKTIYQYGEVTSETIGSIFSANKFNLLKSHLSRYNVFLLSEFTPEIFIKYTKAPSVGLKRLYDVLDSMSGYLIKDSKQSFNDLYFTQQISEPLKQEKKLYILKFLCSEQLWLDFIESTHEIFVDRVSLSKIIKKIENTPGRKKKILKKINTEIESNIQTIQRLDVNQTKKNIKNYDKYSKLTPLNFFEIVGIKKDCLEEVNNQYQLEHIHILNLPLNEIESLINNNNYTNEKLDVLIVFKNILWIIEHCLNSIENIEDIFLCDLKEVELFIYKHRIIENKTLQEVGDEIGITRERTRQIEKKVKSIIQNIMVGSVNPGVQLYLTVIINEIIFLEDLMFPDIVNKFLIEDNQIIGFYEKLNIIYLKTSNNIEIIKEVDNNLSSLPLLINKNKLIGMINSHPRLPLYVIDLIINNLNKILISYGYTLYGDLFVYKTVNGEQRIQYIVESFEDQMIDLSNNEDIILFRKKYNFLFPGNSEYLNCDDDLLVRKMRGSIERSTQYIMTDASTFKIYDYHLSPKQLINEIYEYLIEHFDGNIVISYKKIYDVFEEKLIKDNITPYMMYYLLKYTFSEMFDFGKGNTMYIYVKGAEKITTEEIVYNKVAVSGGFLKKTSIANELGLELYTIDQAISNSKRLKTIAGIAHVTDVKLEIIPQVLRVTIEKLSNKLLDEFNFISIEKIFHELKFNEKIVSEMVKSNINEPRDLLIILKIMFPEIQGNTKFLYRKENPLEISEVVLQNFEVGEKFTRSDILKEGEKLGYAVSTIHFFIKKWQRIDKIILINESYFVLSESIQISNNTSEKVKVYLEKKLSNRKYLALYNIKGFRRELPTIRPYSWSPELIYYLGKKAGFSFVYIENIIHSVDPIIVLNTNKPNLTYRELLVEAMENYEANLHEEEVCNYLIDLGLMVQRKNNPKELPYEILTEQVIRVNEIGIVEKVEGD